MLLVEKKSDDIVYSMGEFGSLQNSMSKCLWIVKAVWLENREESTLSYTVKYGMTGGGNSTVDQVDHGYNRADTYESSRICSAKI